MTSELFLVSMVQRMASETVPGLADAEAGARGVALDSFAGGASVGEASAKPAAISARGRHVIAAGATWSLRL